MITILAIVLLVASGMAQPSTVTQSLTQNADGFTAATTQTAQNTATATSPGSVAVVTQNQAITQNAGTNMAGTATVTQTGQNSQPGTSTGAAGSSLTAAINQNAVTTAGGTLNQRARNNDLSLVSGSANQVITQAITQTASAGAATNINQGGIGGGANPAMNRARNLGANGAVQQSLTQTADGGNNVAQRAVNGGPVAAWSSASPGAPVAPLFNGGNGARANGVVAQTLTQNAGQTTLAQGGVVQQGENLGVPSDDGATLTQAVTQAGTTAGTGVGASVTQTANNFQANWYPWEIDDLVINQAITQTGRATGGVAANVVNQNAGNFGQQWDANGVFNQVITATAWGTFVNQGTVVNPMRNWVDVNTYMAPPWSATVNQAQTLTATATGLGNAVQASTNTAAALWAPAATGTLAQAIQQQNAGFAAATQAALNN